jgi:hypothetical protein
MLIEEGSFSAAIEEAFFGGRNWGEGTADR